MNKILKIAGITAGTLLGLLILAFIVLKLISDDQYKEWITGGVQSATGRDFAINSLDIDLNTSLKIKANGVRMANAEWGSQPDMLTVGELEAEVRLLSLLGGVADVRTVVKQAAVLAENNTEGTSNWAIGTDTPAEGEVAQDIDASPDESGLPVRPLIREFRIEDFVLTLIEKPGAEGKTAHIESLLIETPQTDTTLSLAAAIGQIPVKLSGNLGAVSEIVDRRSSPLELDGNVGNGIVGISGDWGPLMPKPNMNLKLNVEIPSTAQALSMIGYELQELGIAKVNIELAAKDGQFSIGRILTGLDGDVAAASVKGSISDLTSLKGIDIAARAKTTGLNQLLEQFNIPGLPADLPPNVEVSGRISGSLDDLSIKDFVATVVDEGVEVKISGTIDNVLSSKGIDATVTADVASTSALSKYAGLNIPGLGALSLSANVSSADKAIALSNLDTRLVSENINLNITGGVADLITVSGIEASLNTEISSLTTTNITEIKALLDQLGIQAPLDMLPESIRFSAQASGDREQLAIGNIDSEVRDNGILITLTGAVDNAMAPEGIDLALGFNAETTSALSKYAGMELPELGKVEVSGKLRSENKAYMLEDLNAGLDGGNISLKLTGGVGDLVGVSGIKSRMELDIDSLTERNLSEIQQLLDQFNIEVPLDLLPAGVRLHANAIGDLKKLTISDVDAEVRDTGILVTLKGGIENAITQEGINAGVTFNSDSLAALSKYAQRELPEVGALDIAAKITSQDKVFKLENMDAKLGADNFSATLNAGVNQIRLDELMTDKGVDMSAISGIQVALESTIDSLDAFSELAQTELPATDPIMIKANVSDGAEGDKRTAKATVNVQTGGAALALEALLANLTAADHLDISVLVEADSLSDFNKLTQSELPEKGPLRLSGTAKARPDEYSLDDFQLTLDDQSANGFVGIKMAATEADNHTLLGELNIPYLDLSPLLAGLSEPEAAAEQADTTTTTATEPATKDVKEEQEIAAAEEAVTDTADRLFSTDPLPLEKLRKIDADFSVNAQRLVLGKTDLTNLNVVLLLKEGLLSVDPIKSLAGIGSLDGKFILDAREDVAKLGIDILMDDIPMPILGGGLDSKVKLDGDGGSMANLMGSLDGRVIVVVRDGTIPHGFATNFGSGLLSFSGGKEETKLECGILRVDIKDGKADFDDKLAVQLSDVTWRGGGDINLKTEELDVGVAPKPRKGVGISAGGLASLVHVGGTLKNPSVQLDPKDVAVKYGKYMAAVSTGGLSILAGVLFDKTQANMDVCEAILSGTVFDEDAAVDTSKEPATGEQSSNEGASDQTTGKPQDAPDTEKEEDEHKMVPKNLQ